MKGCTTQEDFQSAIEHGYAINDLHPNQTQETTSKFLDTTTQNVTKVDGRYTAGSKSLGKTVTTEVGKKYSYSPFGNKELLEDQANVGNFIHDINREFTLVMLKEIEGKSTQASIEGLKKMELASVSEGLKKIETQYGRSLGPQALVNSFTGIRDLLLEVYSQQRVINQITKTTGVPVIKTEQVIIDPKRNIGGTVDFLAILSDNTAIIRDYKTKITKFGNRDVDGFILDFEKTVTKTDREKYKLQTGEYGRILRQIYGIKFIRKVEVIPISVNVDTQSKTKYKTKINSLFFPGQDKLLEKILPFSTTTNFKSLDEFIRKIDERISKIEDQLRKNPKDRDSLLDKLDSLTKSKNDILINHSMDKLVAYIRSLSSKINEAEANNMELDELQELISELKTLSGIAESTYDYRKYLTEHVNKINGKTGKEVADEMGAQIAQVITEVDDKIKLLEEILYQSKITALIEAKTGFKITDEYGNFIPFSQEGYFGNWFYQLSQFENPIFQSLRKILDEVNYKVRQEQDKITEEITSTEAKVYSWLSKSGKTHDDLIKIMVNPETDNFWSKYSKEFGSLLSQVQPENYHEYYTEGENYKDWYETKLQQQTDKFNNDPNLSQQEKEAAIIRWKENNDLTVVNNKALYPQAWYNAKRYNKLKVIDNPESYNDAYKYILSIPELKAYYEMFEKYNQYFRRTLGVEYSKLPNNFLPNIRKTASERLSEFGALHGTQSAITDFFKDLSIREDDKSYDNTFDERKNIPIFFLNRFKNADDSLAVGEKSYQFGRSLALFAKMALNHQHLEMVQAEILGLQSFLQDKAEQVMQARGRNVTDQLGNSLSEKLNSTDMPKVFNSFVDMYLYGIGVKPELFDKSGKAEKILLKAKEYFTLKALGLNVIAATGSFLSAKTQAIIEGNKGIIYTRDQYLGTLKDSYSDREKFLAINAFFDPMNHRHNNPRLSGEKVYGERTYADPTMKGFVNKYVNSRMLMNAFSIGDQYIEEVILVSMAKNYYVDEPGNVRKIKDGLPHEGRTIWELFQYSKDKGASLSLTDEQVSNVFNQFRRAVQAGQSRIKGTIPEEDKAYWQSQLMGTLVMHFKSWVPGIMFERFGKVKYDPRIDSIYMGKYVALGQELKNPDKLAVKEYFRQIVFPKFGQFTKHLLLFGKAGKLNNKADKQLAFAKWLEMNPHYKNKVTFEEFDDVQQKQLRSMMQELRVILLFATLILMLGFDWDDDGDKDYKQYLLARKLMSVLYKTKQEMAFVYNPVDFANLIKNPIPTIGLVSDAWKTISNTGDEILDVLFGEERLIGGETDDKQPVFYQSGKWVPGFAGFTRLIDLFNSDTQYQNTQN